MRPPTAEEMALVEEGASVLERSDIWTGQEPRKKKVLRLALCLASCILSLGAIFLGVSAIALALSPELDAAPILAGALLAALLASVPASFLLFNLVTERLAGNPPVFLLLGDALYLVEEDVDTGDDGRVETEVSLPTGVTCALRETAPAACSGLTRREMENRIFYARAALSARYANAAGLSVEKIDDIVDVYEVGEGDGRDGGGSFTIEYEHGGALCQIVLDMGEWPALYLWLRDQMGASEPEK